MSVRFLHVLVSAVVVGVVGFVTVSAIAAPSPGPVAQSHSQRALRARCTANLLGFTRPPARAVAHRADPQLAARFALFRESRSAGDVLPTAARLGAELAAAGAVSYDPSAAVRVARTGARAAVYAVPATISLPSVSPTCRAALGTAAVADYLAYQNLVRGSGPGACLVSTALEPNPGSGAPLPGAPPPRPRLEIANAGCESETALAGYAGSLGVSTDAGIQRALVPDGIDRISYALADGRSFTVPVTGNIALVPPDLSGAPILSRSTAVKLRRVLAAQLPTAVTENGPGGSPSVVLTRPVALLSDAVSGILLEARLLNASPTVESSSSSGFGASCSARTHRCVAVTVSTICPINDRCQTSRTIHRYRYVGSKPPAGTTGPDTQPTAPIVGRTNRLVRRPKKLALVLSGPARRRVDVVLSVSCFSSHEDDSGGVPLLKLAVPSRTPIALPGPARATACDVGALVLSKQRGPVHVTVARG